MGELHGEECYGELHGEEEGLWELHGEECYGGNCMRRRSI